MNELALFAGSGGGILGGHLLGWRTVCAVEIENYPRRVLLARQRDGMLPRFPIWDDVTTFDGRPWRGRVGVISGGFPCQDISAAGKGAGITGSRSGLWSHMARIIGEVRPRYVFVENSPLLVSRGLDIVLSDLAAMGFDAEWGVIGAHHTGAPHKRDRVWIMADTEGICSGGLPKRAATELPRSCVGGENVADTQRQRQQGPGQYVGTGDTEAGQIRETDRSFHGCEDNTGWWESEPELGRVAHGVAHRVDRLKAIGNGQIPAVAALAWQILNERAPEV